MGVLTLVDRGALAAVCQAWGDYVEARKLVNGLECKTVPGNNGTEFLNPLIKLAMDAEKRYLTLAQEFGLTPASRSRVRVEIPKPKQGVQEFARARGA